MLKREIKSNFKSFLLWTILLISLFLIVFLIYPSIIKSDNVKMLDSMMDMFPKELLNAFNMDISSISSVFGWIKSEGFVFVLLFIGCFSGILGSNILLKEESDKTIEYLNSLPIKRTTIVLNKVLAGIFYIILIVAVLGIFNYFGLLLSGDFNQKQYILLSITPLFSSVVIFFFCMFMSLFAHKTRKMLGFSLGFVLISYILQMFSSLSDTTKFLKYFSVFSLADIRNVIIKLSINPWMVFISLVLSLLFLVLIIIRYNKKELI